MSRNKQVFFAAFFAMECLTTMIVSLTGLPARPAIPPSLVGFLVGAAGAFVGIYFAVDAWKSKVGA